MSDLYMYLTIQDGITYITKRQISKIEKQGAKVVKCEWQEKNGIKCLKNDINSLEHYTKKERDYLISKGVKE